MGLRPVFTAPPEIRQSVADSGQRAEAIFAGGCFWCMEDPFDQVDGVVSTISGYTGGHPKNPRYRQVALGDSGHAEALQVVYDPERVSYEQLLALFWKNVDPTDAGGQFCDRGDPYRSEIFTIGEQQHQAAVASRARLQRQRPFDRPIVTPITPASTFYPAEGYHQDYYLKNPLRYRFYRFGCGRDARLWELWGSP
jgi:peptide-methionine (S)-S-oxide reductase